MNILVLDEWLPSICNSGKSIRTFQLLAPLAKKHRITYLANLDPTGQENEIRKMQEAGFDVLCVPRPKIYDSALSILVGALPALLTPEPISVCRHFSHEYASTAKRLVEERNIDLVHFEWSHYAVYEPYLKMVPRFICTHNVEYLSWWRSISATRNPARKLLGFHESTKMFRFEKRAYRSVDYLSVVSEDDARLVREQFGVQDVCVIPNGVAIDPYDGVPNTPKTDRLVYCGSMDASVNQDAVLWFIREIFPLVLQDRPEAEFVVIGRNPPQWMLNMQNNRIRFTGVVEDIRRPLKEGMVEVVPLRIGGGTRLKILEAFAARLPVVSTSIGAEGLNVENERNILLADSARGFADQCVRLLEDEAMRRRLTEEGRRLVDEQYDWSRISPLVEAAWSRTIERKHE